MVRVLAWASKTINVRERLPNKRWACNHRPAKQVFAYDLDFGERVRLCGPGYGLWRLAHDVHVDTTILSCGFLWRKCHLGLKRSLHLLLHRFFCLDELSESLLAVDDVLI